MVLIFIVFNFILGNGKEWICDRCIFSNLFKGIICLVCGFSLLLVVVDYVMNIEKFRFYFILLVEFYLEIV